MLAGLIHTQIHINLSLPKRFYFYSLRRQDTSRRLKSAQGHGIFLLSVRTSVFIDWQVNLNANLNRQPSYRLKCYQARNPKTSSILFCKFYSVFSTIVIQLAKTAELPVWKESMKEKRTRIKRFLNPLLR